jgi:hypothetical protein
MLPESVILETVVHCNQIQSYKELNEPKKVTVSHIAPNSREHENLNSLARFLNIPSWALGYTLTANTLLRVYIASYQAPVSPEEDGQEQ